MPPEFFNTAESAINEGEESWANLGWWKGEDNYSEACRNLAVELGSLAGLDDSSHVLDIGFGCGDQLLLWLEHFGVASLQGVNLSVTQTRGAAQLLQRHGRGQHCEFLQQGDAGDTRLWPVPGAPHPSHILCLDSVYHLPERGRIFAHAASSLAAGGKLCLTDFILADAFRSNWQELALRAMLRASRIPRDNMTTLARYAEQLTNAGFNPPEVKDISSAVMPGFSNWWSRYRPHADGLPMRSRLKYATTARFLDWAYQNRVLRYVMISAQRKP